MANVTQFNRTNAGEAILLDVQGLQDALQCGRGTALKIARQADAEIRVGRRCLYKRKKIEEYIENGTRKTTTDIGKLWKLYRVARARTTYLIKKKL